MYVRSKTACLLGAALLLTGCSAGNGGGNGNGGGKGEKPRNPTSAPAPTPEPVTQLPQQPKESDPFWVNPDGAAARQAAAYEKAGKTAEAAQVREIAEQPTGQWLGPENPEQEARGFTEAADRADRTPLLVLYNIPHRDCGQYSQGGAADGAAYRDWIAAVARGIADRPALVVLEPDALLHLVDGCTPQEFHEERYDLLDDAVTALKSLKNTKVYLDAGNAGWGHPDQIFEPLRRAGLERADGFAVNVSNFYSTETSVDYGRQLSAKLGGKHFVIDTSRNGNGPYEDGDPAERWCNPPGRALGPTPTTTTADPLVDAYLWVKRPGESDGECKGGPKAGDWWPTYALQLARG
ncbi:endoglucanase [Streptomyces sp. yr375]|uniref:glycoside hydrolase family 6 protein n=1 Tax=Streptomyces sp. yr375 TaxID=1761906 RepID=UPI0008ABCB7D|nr:glycoside hydrolase family 6 protein [Streptomyces sp. yr375]SEQ33032.1 endoglucanase [Streptomyces sp. yr375]